MNYDFLLKAPLASQWSRIGLKRRSGVIVPLFSIKSQDSAGIGEYPDLKLMIDWCKLTGNSILQLLPLNDTNFLPSPFSPITSIGLNPIHISLLKVDGGANENERIQNLFKKEKRVDYRVGEEKIKALKKLFLKQKLSKDFYNFIEDNRDWLEDYGAFKGDSLFWQWIQWLAFCQMREVKEYAKQSGVFLKGDLPHFISGNSVDCKANSDWFLLDQSAGAPPDEFSATGQDWGIPPYNWPAIEEDDFTFIKRRLSYAENFYDLFRIDHVIGLFRTWLVKENRFDVQRGEAKRGEKILRAMIESSSMLPCAEDMGTIPNFCRQTIKKLGIPGLDIERGQRRHRQLAVSTLSTHDMDLFPEWAGLDKINSATQKAVEAPAIFTILLLFDWLFFSGALDQKEAPQYRINRPDLIDSPNNWSVTLPYSVEELIKLSSNKKILEINQLRTLATPLI